MVFDIMKPIYIGIALAVLFIMLSTMVMPYFSTAFRYAQDVCWTGTAANCDYDTNTNSTVITNSTAVTGTGLYGVCAPTATNFATAMCLHITTAGGYRSITQAVILLIFFFTILGFALRFLPKKK